MLLLIMWNELCTRVHKQYLPRYSETQRLKSPPSKKQGVLLESQCLHCASGVSIRIIRRRMRVLKLFSWTGSQILRTPQAQSIFRNQSRKFNTISEEKRFQSNSRENHI
ncbi:hypothetical protein V5799_005551 [Amblyomma americanum]|uniref:Uncharacterized protein n=1 Tax=Amblyomma americanum TaxID=6943 RepID=A0AAQ4DYX9_AMBAM